MQYGTVAYWYSVFKYGFWFVIGAMDDGTVLDVALLPDWDFADIPSDYSFEPDTTILPNMHTTNNVRIICKPAWWVNLGGISSYRDDISHLYLQGWLH